MGVTAAVLIKQHCKKSFLTLLLIVPAVLSFSMVLTTGCQIGLIHQQRTLLKLQSGNPELHLRFLEGEETRQTSVVGVRMASHLIVIFSSLLSIAVVNLV